MFRTHVQYGCEPLSGGISDGTDYWYGLKNALEIPPRWRGGEGEEVKWASLLDRLG